MYVYTHVITGGTLEDNLERTQVFLTKAQKKELKRIAYETNSSQSEQIRKAVSEYLERKREGK